MFLDDKAPNDTPPRRAIQAAGIPNQNVVVIHWGTDVATGTEDAQRLSDFSISTYTIRLATFVSATGTHAGTYISYEYLCPSFFHY